MNIITLLNQAIKKKLLNLTDVHFAITVAHQEKPAIILAAACISYITNQGNSCLPLSHFSQKTIFANKNKKLIDKLWNIAKNPENWETTLLNSNIVSDGSKNSPLIISNNNLYLHYLWVSEKIFMKFISNNKKNKIDITLCRIVLQSLFHNKNENIYQKIAIAMTMIWKYTFIIGGPGTGKTTTIAKILTALIRISKKRLKIKLATPTGKASARLTESLQSTLDSMKLKISERKLFPSHAITLHALLGINKDNNIPFFNGNNLLNIDLLIIDESSMIDLWIMAQLITALPKKSKIIFLGDVNQLPSVHPGSVFKDIYRYYNDSYSESTTQLINNITKCNIKKVNKNNNLINDSICVLNKNYRFDVNSDITLLEHDIKENKINKIKKIFHNGYKNIKYHEIKNKKQYFNMIEQIIQKYKKYIKSTLKNNIPEKIIKKFHHYRILCAVKEGYYGIKKINAYLENAMQKNKIINNPYLIDNEIWYVGKPIMIIENDASLKLLNGDVGITLLNKKNKLNVFFILNKSIKSIPINILPKYETTWAMTIHKSQGSEFSHVILILPDFDYPVLNQEILYTAITRTRKKLTIYANKKIFLKTILKKNKRYSLLSHTNN